MKPDYRNWVPKGMLFGVIAGTAAALVLYIIFGVVGVIPGKPKLILGILFGVLFVILLIYSALCILWYNAFSYNGKRQMSRQIIEGIACYVKIPDGGTGLDVGCGSGALTIACAKKNPKSNMVGLDRWGKEYASFNKPLCESNAKIEGVDSRTQFVRGDACRLDFPDETFDAVTSNYCYHNIGGVDKQKLLLETLRVLKKGGTFAIHDIMSKSRYGDMDKFVQSLLDQGYQKAKLIDTANGKFMSPGEAKILGLSGSMILTGVK